MCRCKMCCQCIEEVFTLFSLQINRTMSRLIYAPIIKLDIKEYALGFSQNKKS